MSTAQDFPIPQWTQGDRMRKALESAGFSVNEAAMRFGVARNTVSNWIHDNTKPTPTELEVWANWTGVPLQWIKTGEGAPGPDDGTPVTHRFQGVASASRFGHVPATVSASSWSKAA